MFKYFDIQNRGKVNFDQFYRAMEKTGITMERSVSIKFFFYLYSNINFLIIYLFILFLFTNRTCI